MTDDIPRLTRAVARGDAGAFERLYEAYYERLRRYLLVLARGDAELAADALQESWMRVVRNLKPQPDAAVLWSWLSRVARSALIDRLRRSRRHNCLLPLPAELPDSGPDSGSAALLEKLQPLLQALPEAERRLLEDKYQRGRSTKELARERGTTPKAIENKLRRLRQALRERLFRRLGDG